MTMDNASKKVKSMKNAEKRRERSKVAARCRRGKESEIFTDLSASLPVSEESKAALDKASVMRLTLCNLKIRNMVGSIQKEKASVANIWESQSTAALSGFVICLDLDGDVIYASEEITAYLGIPQLEVMGQSLFDLTHQYDHSEIKGMLKEENSSEKVSVLFRMKCTASSRGRNAHLRANNYKTVSCVGRMIGQNFVAVCEPLLHPSDVEIPLKKQSFLSKHSASMGFEYVDERVKELLGYEEKEMMGKSLFQFLHAFDTESVGKAFKGLYEKEQALTERYRFLTKGGGWVWLVTQATLVQGQGKGHGHDSVVCIHFITSEREEEDVILSEVQMGQVEEKEKKVLGNANVAVSKPRVQGTASNIPMSTVNLHHMTMDEEDEFIKELLVGPFLQKATCSTAKIFAPKTADMDTGFLMPIDDKTLIASKEEPADLTHLAPIAGDEVVPLEDVPLLEDLLASLEESDEYLYLPPDSAEIPIPAFMQPKPITTMMKGKEELPGNIPTTVKPPFSSPPDLSVSPPPGAMTLPFSGELRTAPVSPSPDLFSVPMKEVQAQVMEIPHTEANEKKIPALPPDRNPPSPEWGLLQEAAKLLSQQQVQEKLAEVEDSEPPKKIQKVQAPVSEPQRVYILVPYQPGRSRSNSMSSGTGSSNRSDSEDETPRFELINLQDKEQQEDIKGLLASMGMMLKNEDEEQELARTVPGGIPPLHRKRSITGSLLGTDGISLHELTRLDCEVNAPVGGIADLLQGPELLTALESACPEY